MAVQCCRELSAERSGSRIRSARSPRRGISRRPRRACQQHRNQTQPGRTECPTTVWSVDDSQPSQTPPRAALRPRRNADSASPASTPPTFVFRRLMTINRRRSAVNFKLAVQFCRLIRKQKLDEIATKALNAKAMCWKFPVHRYHAALREIAREQRRADNVIRYLVENHRSRCDHCHTLWLWRVATSAETPRAPVAHKPSR